MKKLKKIISVVLIIGAVLTSLSMLYGCKNEDTQEQNQDELNLEENTENEEKENEEEKMTENPKVIINMTDGKAIKLELFPDIAPITVANFLKLVDDKYYDGLIFHRIIGSFMIQGGGYYIKNNQLCEAPDLTPIKGEFSSNGVKNTLSHDAGVISMARTSVKDSATSQFFICTNGYNKASLDGNYAAFGRTIDQESMDNVLAIAAVETATISSLGMSDFPYPDIPTIQTIRRLN